MDNNIKRFNYFTDMKVNEAKESITKEDLQTRLDSMKKSNPELNSLEFHNSDGRLGKKLALAVSGDSGTIDTKTDYMTYNEMDRFLLGYACKSDNRFKITQKTVTTNETVSEAESFLLDILGGLEEYVSDDYPESIYYMKDDKFIFEYNTKKDSLYYSYEYIWLVCYDKYKLKYQEIGKLIKSMVGKHLKLDIRKSASDLNHTYPYLEYIKKR